MQPEVLAEFLLFHRVFLVDFVPEDHERHALELLHLEERVQLALSLSYAISVGCVNHEDDAVQLGAVFFPGLASLLMPSQVVGIEPNVSDSDFCLVRVDGGVCLGESVALQHVEQSSFACVVQS